MFLNKKMLTTLKSVNSMVWKIFYFKGFDLKLICTFYLKTLVQSFSIHNLVVNEEAKELQLIYCPQFAVGGALYD